jgi:hypothetical protein
VLTKFFLAPEVHGHLRGLAEEFGESTNSIRLELNRFEQGGLLISGKEQNRKVFRAKRNHPLFGDITSILRKHMGVDSLVEQLISRLGNVSSAYLLGNFALGRDSDHLDLVLIGEEINVDYLDRLTAKAEKLINRKIYYTILTTNEEESRIKGRKDVWKIWGK